MLVTLYSVLSRISKFQYFVFSLGCSNFDCDKIY